VQFKNSRGTPVDPVPFLVVTGFVFLVSFSYGPGYCLALGLRGPVVFLPSCIAFVGLAVGAYHRLVWTHRPSLRGEIPPEQRLLRLFYAVLIGIALLTGLTLPLLWVTS
jgi:hypothetical protein